MDYRKWKETKQQPGTAGPGNMLSCSLVSFHFLWAILWPHPVLLYEILSPRAYLIPYLYFEWEDSIKLNVLRLFSWLPATLQEISSDPTIFTLFWQELRLGFHFKGGQISDWIFFKFQRKCKQSLYEWLRESIFNVAFHALPATRYICTHAHRQLSGNWQVTVYVW